jgi:hypothetical protein
MTAVPPDTSTAGAERGGEGVDEKDEGAKDGEGKVGGKGEAELGVEEEEEGEQEGVSTAEPAAKSNTGGAAILRAFLFSRLFRASPVAERVGRTKGASAPSIHVCVFSQFFRNLN